MEINYETVAETLNGLGGSWSTDDVKTWFNGQDEEDFSSLVEIVEAICYSGMPTIQEVEKMNAIEKVEFVAWKAKIDNFIKTVK